ncbi:MAG: 5'-nucleotidase C-terminal domain-containing protein [Acidimicrobiaceae bacterium]|nr:5'-nucleotidase C-terminal domain-containing protein [Acidimicrobiaceae bacterium]
MSPSRAPRLTVAAAITTVVVIVMVPVLVLWGSQATGQQEDDGLFTLTILHNNDGESKLRPAPDLGYPGVAAFVEVLVSLQSAAGDAVVTLTSGDNLLVSRELAVSLERSGPFYDSLALSGLYDAMALGNHDFDLGPDVTARFIGGFDPAVPFLSANLDFSDEPVLETLLGSARLAPSTVLEVAGQRVGVIGVVTSTLSTISSPRNVAVSAVLPAVKAETEKLIAMGVNKIILVSHLQDVAEEVALVEELAGVDVVIAGGGDDLLRNPGDSCLPEEAAVGPYPIRVNDASGAEVPIVTVPGGYRCIGKLQVIFDAAGVVVASSGGPVGVGLDLVGDTRVDSRVVVPLSEAVAAIDSEVIGSSAVELDGRKSRVRTATTNAGNLMADALRATATRLASQYDTQVPDVAIQNGGGIRNDSVISPGDITVGTTWAIAPFLNFVVVGAIPRGTFKVLLEQALDRLPNAGGQFPQVSGFKLTYDPSAKVREINRDDCSLVGHTGSRVTHAVLDDGTVIVRDGKVVPGDPIVLATIDFLANGGDCYPLDGLTMTHLGVSYRQALADYIAIELDGVIAGDDYRVDGNKRITAQDSAGQDPAAQDPKVVTHIVVDGDTLWGIARQYLGSGALWQRIFKFNEGVDQQHHGRLIGPELILPGWVLLIPR